MKFSDRQRTGATLAKATRAAIKRHSGEELDIKPYEADMRHLINTYIQADRAEDHPPHGRVTLVAPKSTRLEVARAYAISKLGSVIKRESWQTRRESRRASS